jgi:beta-lactamase superfamily II metal-dependent hydrolase
MKIAQITLFSILLFSSPVLGGELSIHFLNVGHADAALVKTPAGRTMLVDSGMGVTAGKVKRYLAAQGIKRLDVVILSHYHQDHYGGMKSILKAFEVGELIEPGYPQPGRAIRAILKEVKKRNVRHTVARRGDTFTIGDLHLEVLSPPKVPLQGDSSLKNANSLVVRACCGEVSILFTGDIGAGTEKFLIQSRTDVRADILKAPHHGAGTRSTPAFLDAVQPAFMAIQCGLYNQPSRKLYDRLEKRDILWYRNDVNGAVAFRFAHGKREELRIEVERGRVNSRFKVAPDWTRIAEKVEALPGKAKRWWRKQKNAVLEEIRSRLDQVLSQEQ